MLDLQRPRLPPPCQPAQQELHQAGLHWRPGPLLLLLLLLAHCVRTAASPLSGQPVGPPLTLRCHTGPGQLGAEAAEQQRHELVLLVALHLQRACQLVLVLVLVMLLLALLWHQALVLVLKPLLPRCQWLGWPPPGLLPVL